MNLRALADQIRSLTASELTELNRLIGEEPPGPSGVREPLRPRPSGPPSAVAVDAKPHIFYFVGPAEHYPYMLALAAIRDGHREKYPIQIGQLRAWGLVDEVGLTELGREVLFNYE